MAVVNPSKRPSSDKQHENQSSEKCCIGALYYSQSLMDRRLPPICAGLRKKPQNENGWMELQTDSAELVDFKYLCLGYSVYDEDRMTNQPDRLNLTEGQIDLPYCEGMQVVSSRQLQQEPVLLKEGLNGEARSSEGDSPDSKKKRGFFGDRENIPSFVSDPGKIDWEHFPEKFLKSSSMIISKMHYNAQHLIDSIKRILDR